MMFDNYLSSIKLDMLYDEYDNDYINSLDKDNFKKIYDVFLEYGFYFIDDIIINYLEIFELDEDIVREGLEELKNRLGSKFNYIIGSDMRYLDIFR